MKKKSYLSLYTPATIALPILAAVIAFAYTLAMSLDFEYSIEHFKSGSVLFWVFAIAAALSAVISGILALTAKKSIALTSIPAPSILSLFAVIILAVMCIGVFFTELKAETASTIGGVQKLGTVLALTIALSSALATVKKYRGTALHRVCAIFAAISVNITMFACYFDFSQPLNGPVRNATTIMQCAILLFLLSELRLSFGKDNKAITSAFYVFANCTAAALGMGFALGGLVDRIISQTPGNPHLPIFRLGMYAAIALIAIDRMFALRHVVSPISNEDK